MQVLAAHLRTFLDYAQIRGAASPVADLAARLPAGWEEAQVMLSEEEFYAALNVLNQAVGDPVFGIKSANFMSLKLLGVIYQISMQANTIGEAFHYLRSYLHTTLPIVAVSTGISAESASVTLKMHSPEARLDRVVLENILTIISRELKMMARHIVAIRLTSPHCDETYPPGWVYGATFSLSFDSIVLKASLNGVQQLHLDVLVPQYVKMISQLGATERFSDKVRITILSMSDPALPNIGRVCDTLYLTPRTLQRRLLREKVTYREISEELKKQICSFLLLHESYPVTTLSYILGYSEPASFIHSFKKWYGDSPQRVRKTLRTAG